VNYQIWPYRIDHPIYRISIAYVYLMVIEVWNVFFESPLVPARISLRTEEDRTLVIVYPVYLESSVREIQANFGTDQTIRSGY
jgi:hypothetical protein